MSVFQTLCLLMYNDGEEFSLDEIKAATKIGEQCIHLHCVGLLGDPITGALRQPGKNKDSGMCCGS